MRRVVVAAAAICGALSLSAAPATPAPQAMQAPQTTPLPASEPAPLATSEPAPLATSEPAPKKEATPPFYRKYLVPGDRLDDQIVEQEKRVAESPADANLRNDFGNLLAKRKFPKEAAEQYEMAAKLDKSNFIAFYNLGLLRETEGKVDDAISAYRKSIKRKPGFPPSRFRLGRLYERVGKPEEAIAEYAQAFRTDPSMRDPRRNPLVIDSELIYRASLTNYSRDLATVVEGDAVYAEESRFKKVPVDRAVAAEELEPQEPAEAAPREVGPGGAAGSVPEGTHPKRPRPPVAGEGSGIVGGPQPRPASPRINRMNRPAPPPRPTPVPEEIAPEPETPAPEQEPGQDQPNPEATPDAPPEDVEPS